MQKSKIPNESRQRLCREITWTRDTLPKIARTRVDHSSSVIVLLLYEFTVWLWPLHDCWIWKERQIIGIMLHLLCKCLSLSRWLPHTHTQVWQQNIKKQQGLYKSLSSLRVKSFPRGKHNTSTPPPPLSYKDRTNPTYTHSFGAGETDVSVRRSICKSTWYRHQVKEAFTVHPCTWLTTWGCFFTLMGLGSCSESSTWKNKLSVSLHHEPSLLICITYTQFGPKDRGQQQQKEGKCCGVCRLKEDTVYLRYKKLFLLV